MAGRESAARSTPRRSEPVARRRADGGQFDNAPTPPGMGSLSHRVRNFKNPNTLAGRREASRNRYQ